jgi:hypothetical protein
MIFEIRHLTADGGERFAEPPSGTGKAPSLDRRDEDGHGFQAVHERFLL